MLPTPAMTKVLLSEDKLALLRKADRTFDWPSLDERRRCALCDREFSGRQVFVRQRRGGGVTLHCPTEECPGSPEVWVHPGNPLCVEQAWNDWARLFMTYNGSAATRPA